MKNALSKYFSDKKNWKTLIIIGGILPLLLIVLIPFSLAADVAISSVEIKSENLNYDENVPGSFKITKSAKWISSEKAQITFEVDTVVKTDNKYRDIILVLDISGSMNGEKLDRVKSDSVELVNRLLSDSNNRVALITFSTKSQILSNLTNAKDELIDKINNLQVGGSTNYYQALVNVDSVLKDYQKENDREVIALFLTDGSPNEDIPNEESQFRFLKEKYPYLSISGVQYEMGSEVLEPIKKVSEQQFVANIENLNNVLFQASVVPITYDNFEITDYINTEYFKVENKSNINVSQGDVSLTDNNSKINWNIKQLKSGLKTQMTIEVTLKDEYLNKGGIYPTNTKEEIKSLISNTKENVVSDLTPKLKNNYQVIYDVNAPDGCEVENVPGTEDYSVFDTVTISDNEPTCTEYKFKGWKIATDGVESINEDHFIMPEKDVTIRAEWSKVSVRKSMDGTIYTKLTLYKMMANNSKLDTDIDFSSTSITAGIYEFSSTKDDEYPVYYYRGAVTNNNVKFANFCWKIVRTTSTGGVKLIYNGVPDSNGACNNTGTGTQIGTSRFNSSYSNNAYVGYMYGDVNATTYEETHANINNSTVKTKIDTWYENNMTSYTSYLEDTVWCNDRSIYSGTGIGSTRTYYSAYNRLYTNKDKADINCLNDNDKFTVSSSNGNGALTYPVALITADESVLAGLGDYGYTSSSYLNNGTLCWSLSPRLLVSSNAFVFSIRGGGLDGTIVDFSRGIRPSVSLKLGTKVSDGDGSAESPYVIE